MASSVPSAVEPSGSLGTFRALRYRDFRLLWFGLAVSAIGTWMQIVAQSLLVLKIAHGSAFALGCVSLAQAMSFFLFALIGGSVADRVDKRRLLLFTQASSALLALLLGFLTLWGIVKLWMILVLSFLNGTLLSFDQPTRGALIPEVVPKEDLPNAISLQSMLFNGASTIGPALAGLGVAKLSYAGNFFLNGVSFLVVLVALCFVSVPMTRRRQRSTGQAIRTALVTVRRDAVLPWALSGYGAMLFFAPSLALILPVYATKVLHVGPERLGFLFSAAGVGTIVGALFLASSASRRGATYLSGMFVWVVALAIFAATNRFSVALSSLLVFGFGQTLTATSTITLLQTRVPDELRGRMMSLNTLLIMGVRPLGDFPAGALIGALGAPATIAVSAGLVAVYGVFVSMRSSLRSA